MAINLNIVPTIRTIADLKVFIKSNYVVYI
jgi:hypothetical protein